MTLPASGPLSLSAIQTEFGGSNPISLSEYYAAASGIPASGAISFSQFYGKSSGPPPAPNVEFQNSVAFLFGVTPTNVTASYNVTNSGIVGGSNITTYTWLNTGAASDYELRATPTSGTVDVGSSATGSWLNLGTSQSWSVTRTSNLEGITECTMTMEVRTVAGSVMQSTFTVSIQAEVQST